MKFECGVELLHGQAAVGICEVAVGMESRQEPKLYLTNSAFRLSIRQDAAAYPAASTRQESTCSHWATSNPRASDLRPYQQPATIPQSQRN